MKNLKIEEIKKGRLIGKKKEGYLNLYLYLGVHETLEKLLDIFVTLEYYYPIRLIDEFYNLVYDNIKLNVYHVGTFKLDGQALYLEEETHKYIHMLLTHLLENIIEEDWVTTLDFYDYFISKDINLYDKIEIEEEKINTWILKNQIIGNKTLNLIDLSDMLQEIETACLVNTQLGLRLSFNTFLQETFFKEDMIVHTLKKGDVIYKKGKNRVKFYLYLGVVDGKEKLLKLLDRKYVSESSFLNSNINNIIKNSFSKVVLENYSNKFIYYTTKLNVYNYYSEEIDKLCQ